MEIDGLDELEAEVLSLETTFGSAASMASAFDAEIQNMQSSVAATGQEIAGVSRGLSRGLRKAFDGVIFDGVRLSDALNSLARTMVNSAYSAAVRPVTDHLGGLIAGSIGGIVGGLLPFERGGAFVAGNVIPFATGGIVTGPVAFPIRGGMGVMGEAGPEAIMPLTRGRDGRLGVRMEEGGRKQTVILNISTPDAESFRRSQGQIAAQISRVLARGERNR